MKVIAKLFGTLIKAVLALLILAVLAPILYFAWRANQPMDMPEFKGLTYVQYMDWRKMAYEKDEEKYALAHPNYEVKRGGCLGADLTLQAIGVVLINSEVVKYYIIPEKSQLPRGFEIRSLSDLAMFAWGALEGTLVTSSGENAYLAGLPWCAIHAVIPTPEQYEAMKQERANMTP